MKPGRVLFRLRRQFERRLEFELRQRLQHEFVGFVRRARKNEAFEIGIVLTLQFRKLLARIVDGIGVGRALVLGFGEVRRLGKIGRDVVDLRPAQT